jgi:hypothetical protein
VAELLEGDALVEAGVLGIVAVFGDDLVEDGASLPCDRGARRCAGGLARMASSVRWAITSGSMPNSWTPARRSTAALSTAFIWPFSASGRISSLA